MCVSTGNKWGDLALMIAVGVATGGAGLMPGAMSVGGSALGGGALVAEIAATYGVGAISAIGGGIIAGAGSFLISSMGQQQAAIAQQQQHIPEPKLDITGSGGRNAPAVLAEKIKAIKAQKQTPATPALQTNTSPIDTGLQLSAA